MNHSPHSRSGVALLALLLLASGCGDDSAVSPPDTATTEVGNSTTTSTQASTTTSPPGLEFSGEWVVHDLDGIRTPFMRDPVWDTDSTPGSNPIARDQRGGLVWADNDGLWWLPSGAAEPALVVASSAIYDISGVVASDRGSVVRYREGGSPGPRFVALESGDELADPGGWSTDLDRQVWTVGSISVRVDGPEVVLDAEGQPAEIVEPAHLVVTDNGVEVLDLRIGGVYQAWAQIDDFDGRRLVVSRYVHEPALPIQSFFVIDLSCADCLKVFDAAATRAVLANPQGGTPTDSPLSDPIEVPTSGFSDATPLLTDDGVRDLADGRYLVTIDSLAGPAQVLTGDLMVWFGGEEANIAARIDGETDVPVPNDYYIRNADPHLFSLGVDPTVAITSAWWQSAGGSDLSQKPMTLDELVEVFATIPSNEHGHLVTSPWWITVRDGNVIELDEQYRP